MDYTVHGILQVRILEWVAFPFSRGSSQARSWEPRSPALQVDSLPAEPHGKPNSTGVDSLSCLQIFPNQESNRGLLHCRQILYQLSYQGTMDCVLYQCQVSLFFLFCAFPWNSVLHMISVSFYFQVLLELPLLLLLNRSAVSDSVWPHGLWPTRFLCPLDSPGKNTGVGCHFLLQELPLPSL